LIDALAAAQQEKLRLLREMVRDQEDLDWLVYSALELGGAQFQRSSGTALPEQRPFAWLSKEPPAALDPELTELWVRRRVATQASPLLGMIEQALYKHPFRHGAGSGATSFGVEVAEAADGWLADRVEDVLRSSTAPRSIEPDEIAMGLDQVDVRAVCSLGDSTVAERLEGVLYRYSVPYLPPLRYTASGMKKRAAWARAWEVQRREDTGGAPDGSAGSPPAYTPHDFRDATFWQLRGKLDVPRERFILYQGVGRAGHDRFGWAGWSCHERAAALIDQHETLKVAREDAARLVPLLSGVLELIPWIERWETVRGERGDPSAQALRLFVETEAQRLDLSLEEIRAWRPTGPGRHRRALNKHRSGASGHS
jgi:hypothetical protein